MAGGIGKNRSMRNKVTASQLYDHVACPRRVDLDIHGDAGQRAEISAFVRMLWERGSAHEADVVAGLPEGTLRLGGLPSEQRARLTIQAMENGVGMIQGGRIEADDLVGDPDLLVRRAGAYVAADIKSGGAQEGGDGDDDGRPKLHYAVQVALYTDVLERLRLSSGRIAEIWDIHGDRVVYDLDAPNGRRKTATWWDRYLSTREAVRQIIANPHSTRGALASACGLCHWREVCRTELERADDLTLIPALGRAARDGMIANVATVAELAALEADGFIRGSKTMFAGVGPDRLRTFQARARLLTTVGARGYLKRPVELPATSLEIFFDIEADPMRDHTYLHGFVHRLDRDPSTEQFVAFYADEPTPLAERDAFAQAVEHLLSHPQASVFYYSKYERTMYRKLQRRYPEVCDPEAIEALFTPPRSIDLYFDVVTRATEWPTRNHSIKTLAKHLGFSWRDSDPSGAASIEWYHRWIETRDPTIRQRILDYNEDDCRATAVLLDGVRALAEGP